MKAAMQNLLSLPLFKGLADVYKRQIIYRYGIIVIVPLRNIESPKWRNWQTHLTQNQAWLPHVPVRVRPSAPYYKKETL